MELLCQRQSLPVPVIEKHDDALATPRATLVQALRGSETAKLTCTQATSPTRMPNPPICRRLQFPWRTGNWGFAELPHVQKPVQKRALAQPHRCHAGRLQTAAT